MNILRHPGTIGPRSYSNILDQAAHYAVSAQNRRAGRATRYSVGYRQPDGQWRGVGESQPEHKSAVRRALAGEWRWIDEAGNRWSVQEA